MDPIQDMLDRISELSDEELGSLETQALTEFETVSGEDVTQQSVDRMGQLADAVEAVRTEKNRRTEIAAELSRAADEAKTRVKGATPEAEVGQEDAPVVAEAEEDDEEPEVAVAASGDKPDNVLGELDTQHDGEADVAKEVKTVEEAPVAAVKQGAGDVSKTEDAAPAVAEDDKNTETGKDQSEGTVTASAGTPEASEPVIQAPADRQPVARQTAKATVAITAGADIPGVSAGSPLDGMGNVAEAMAQRMHQMRRTSGGDGEQHTVATLVASFPEDRVLRTGDSDGNADKLEAVISPQAITAAGGLCAPVETNYDIFGVGDLNRPVKDALPSFNADRGGIRFLTPPTLTDLVGAVSLWTLQDDIDAATPGAPDPVKPCIRVNCGSEITVYTDAIPLCLTFGNLNARAYPELVARHNELAMIQHARFAETRLLTRIGSLSTQITAARKLSAAIDFLSQVDRATASYRNRHRIANLSPMRVIAPEWLRNVMRTDISMRMPGDTLQGNLMIADASINQFFSSRNVNVTWSMDGEAGQVFGAQTAGALQDYPQDVVWYLFAEGTFLFLDGGTLDLGLVRDSTLNGTNDYKMFVETFEGVAKVGLEALRITSRLTPTGAVAGTVDTTVGA